MPSYRRCAIVIVLRAPKPSLRAASCCSVEVVNGGAGLRLRSLLLHLRDAVGRRRRRSTWVAASVSVPSTSPFLSGEVASLPSGTPASRARKGCVVALGGEADVDAPVLDRVERADLALALDDQPERDRLHAAGRQARPDPPPQQRRDLVADQPVEHAPRLLGIEQLQVDLARMQERLEDRVPGDLGERHALACAGSTPSRVATWYAIASPSRS